MTYMDWIRTVPEEFTSDPVWQVEAYRLSLFASDIGWRDVTTLQRDDRTRKTAGQLYDALGSISANISEGYSRLSGRDKARFYEYALGSARESRSWYFGARHLVSSGVSTHRFQLLTSIAKLLTTMIPDQRTSHLREDSLPYSAGPALDSNLNPFLANPVPFE